jgi:hypothetical protein
MLLKSSHADSIFSKCCVYSRLSEVMQLAASASRGKTGFGWLKTTSWLGKLAHPLSRSGLLGACLKFLTFASVGLLESGSFLLHFRLEDHNTTQDNTQHTSKKKKSAREVYSWICVWNRDSTFTKGRRHGWGLRPGDLASLGLPSTRILVSRLPCSTTSDFNL